MSGASLSRFSELWIPILGSYQFHPEKGRMLTETQSYVAWNVWCNKMCFINFLWYMHVMYAHVSWWDVLLRKINPWLLGDNKIFDCCRGKWILDHCWRFKIFDNLCEVKLYCWGDQEFGLYANLLGISKMRNSVLLRISGANWIVSAGDW